MFKAIEAPTTASASTNRRAVLGAIGAALAAGGTNPHPLQWAGSVPSVPSVPATNPDAGVIAVAGALEAAYRQLDAWDRDLIQLDDDQSDALMRLARKVGDQLAGMRPRTAEGMQAKARATRWVLEGEVCQRPGDAVEDAGQFHERLAWSVVNDVLTAGL